MSFFFIALVWVINFGISLWNAYAVGKCWVETKHSGGWPRFMAWMGAIQSASGFSWCYLILLAIAAWFTGWLNEQQIDIALQLGYLLIIPGVLFSGLMITVDSWAAAYRRRTLGSFGTAAYNTFAQINNTYHAVNGMGKAFRNVMGFFENGDKSRKSNSDKDGGTVVVLVIILVVLALAGGILTTAAIIHRVAASEGRVET
jgi:hypothetical protein